MPVNTLFMTGGAGDEEPKFPPRALDEFIGQERVVEKLKILVASSREQKESLNHILFYGPPGIGKTTLSQVLAQEMRVNIRITTAPLIERAGDLGAILTHLRTNDVLFIDKIHQLDKDVERILHSAMEDFVLDIVVGKGAAAKNVRLNLPKFTVIGATSRLGLVGNLMRTHFGSEYRLDFYTVEALGKIILRGAQHMGKSMDEGGIHEIASRSRGTPRHALRFLRFVANYAQMLGETPITKRIAEEALNYEGIDWFGLEEIDRRILRTIIEKYNGGPVSLGDIAASINVPTDKIEEFHEPYLIQLGFLDRTPPGRVVTRRAYDHYN